MKRILPLLILSLALVPVFAGDFGPIMAQGDIDNLLVNYPAIKPDLDRIFSGAGGARSSGREFAEKVDKSSQMLEVLLFNSKNPALSINEFVESFRDIVSAPKPAEMQSLFSRYNLGENGFGKFFMATTTVLILYTEKFFNEEMAKLPANSNERRYLESKLSSIGEFLGSIHPDDLSKIKSSSLSILKTLM